MNKSILIHNSNTPNNLIVEENIINFNYLKSGYKNIDEYISKEIISILKDRSFNILFIKDNLSFNYLELDGLRLAYHVRLSKELNNKIYIPIVILSDSNGYTLNKLNPIANILFTKNIFITENNQKSIEKFSKLNLKNLTENEYKNEFLNRIDIQTPKESSHDISNEWAIYRWAEFLKVDSKAIRKNREKIASMLYFKYLLAKNPINSNSEDEKKYIPKCSGKILLIDDEWDKGWGDIFDKYFSVNSEIEFIVYNNEYKNINLKSIDIIILDLRITQKDHNNDTPIEELTGIKFAKKIKKENPAIQIIMFTATGNSLILEELYKYDILGYIKKGHPEDQSIKIEESFEKLTTLVDTGLEKQYLKKVWDIQKSIIGLTLLHNIDENSIKIKAEIETIFEILDSDLKNKIKFTILTIFKVLEILTEKYNLSGSEFLKIKKLFQSNGLMKYTKDISQIVCTRNFLVHSGDKSKLNQKSCINYNNLIEHPTEDNILKWFKMLQEILEEIEKIS